MLQQGTADWVHKTNPSAHPLMSELGAGDSIETAEESAWLA